MDLLRDKTAAIEMQNKSQGWRDTAQTLSAVSGILQNIKKGREIVSKGESSQAQSDLANATADADLIVQRYQHDFGERVIEPEVAEQFKREISSALTSRRGDYRWEEAQQIYDTGMDKYITGAVRGNEVFAQSARFKRIDEETRTANAARAAQVKRDVQMATNIVEPYFSSAKSLGSIGREDAFKDLTASTFAALDKVLEDEQIPQERLLKKKSVVDGGVMAWFEGAVLSKDIDIAKRADYALNDLEAFKNTVPAEFLESNIEVQKELYLRSLTNEKNNIQRNLLTAGGDEKRQYEESLKQIDKKIKSLEEDNKIDGSDFDEIATESLRMNILRELTPKLTVALETERLEAIRAEQTAQRARFAEALSRPGSSYLLPMGKSMNLFDTEDMSTRVAKTKSLFSAKNPEEAKRAVQDVQGQNIFFTKVDEKEQEIRKQFNVSDVPDAYVEFAKNMENNYQTFSNNMMQVSPLERSRYTTKLDALEAMYDLFNNVPFTDEYGNSEQWEDAAMAVAAKISGAELTEIERRDMVDFIKEAALGGNKMVQEQKEFLQSADVGIYNNMGLRGVRSFPVDDLGVMDTRSGAIRLSDKRGFVPEDVDKDSKTATYELSGFEKAMRLAQSEYFVQGINMRKAGKTREEVLLKREEIFRNAIDGYYRANHVVDLRALDEKLENHLPAFQEIDGVVYEYLGRDSLFRPLWRDHGVLNTNRDVHRYYEKYKMSGGINSGFGNVQQVKKEDISKSMRAENE